MKEAMEPGSMSHPTSVADRPAQPDLPRSEVGAGAAGAWWRNALVGAAALTVALGALALTWLLLRPLLLLFAAVVIAEALLPAVELLARRLPRAAAVALVYLLLALVVAGVSWYVVPTLVSQGTELIVAVPSAFARLREMARGLDPTSTDQILNALQSRVGRFGLSLVGLPMTLASAAVETALVFLLSAYWLLAEPALRRFALSLLPRQRSAAMADVLGEIGQTIGGYVRGKAISVLVVGVGVYVGLQVIGVEFPLVLALIAAVAELIPIVGIVIATVPAVAVALLESPTQAVIVLVFYIVLQQIESNLLLPYLVRRQSGIPPLLAVFAIIAGQALAGIIGALIAIPLAGALQVVVVRGVAPALRRWTGAPSPDEG